MIDVVVEVGEGSCVAVANGESLPSWRNGGTASAVVVVVGEGCCWAVANCCLNASV